MKFKDASFSFRIWVLLITITIAPPTLEIAYEPWSLKLGPYKLRRVAGGDEPPDDEDEPEEPGDGDDDEDRGAEKRSRSKPRKPTTRRRVR